MQARTVLLTLSLAGCSPWTDVSRPEDAPIATVLTPSEGAIVPSGPVELLGRVSDTEDPPERLYVVWSLGAGAEDGWTDVCHGAPEPESGQTLCAATVDPSITAVRLVVKDVAGFQRVVTQPIQVRDMSAPGVVIDAPVGLGPFYADVPVALDATVTDADGSPDALTLAWSSDVVGPLDGPTLPDPEGRLHGFVQLPQGSHRLTLTARDADGLVSRADSTIHVGAANVAPYVRIDTPVADTVVAVGAALDLSGVALDTVTPAPALGVSWTSDLDGLLGTSTANEAGRVRLDGVTLTEGAHTLSLSATDDAGARTVSTVSVVADLPPSLTLTEPAEGHTLTWPAPLHVSASVSDTVSPTTALRLEVTSDLTGPVMNVGVTAEGHSDAEVVLALGTHVLTIRARDGYGLTTELTRTVHVVAP